MKLDDLQMPMNSQQLSSVLKKHHGIDLPIDQISPQRAYTMLEDVQRKLNRFRSTPQAHLAEQNANYNALMLIEKTLQTKLTEGKIWNATKSVAKFHGDVGKGIAQGLGTVAKGAAEELRDTGTRLGKRAILAIDRHQWGPSGMSFSDLKSKFKQSPRSDSSGSKSKTSQELANTLAGLGDIPSSELFQTLKSGMSSKDPNTQTLAKILSKLIKTPQAISESHYIDRYLAESAMGEAEIVLAAKDLTDRFQDMVETVGKMVNEELPALVETIRDTMTPEQADAFNASVMEILNSALESARTSKDGLDAAARTLAGEEVGTEGGEGAEAGTPGEEAAGTEPADELTAEPAAEEPEAEPLGRGKR